MDSSMNEARSRGLELAEFEETQTFGGTPVGVLVIASSVGSVAIVIGVTAQSAPMTGLFAAGVILAVDLFFLLGLRLRTVVTRDELRVGFRPMPLKRIAIEEITRAEAVKYNPLVDAGGWGWKYSRKHGATRNVWGEHGVAIRYGEKGRMLIGSKRADELAMAIHRLNPASRPTPGAEKDQLERG